MAANIPPSDADIIDELASIVVRVVELTGHATTGLNAIPDAGEVTRRLRRMERHIEAQELEMLMARAEELRLTSSKRT